MMDGSYSHILTSLGYKTSKAYHKKPLRNAIAYFGKLVPIFIAVCLNTSEE